MMSKIKKFIPYIFILVFIIGISIPIYAQAQATSPGVIETAFPTYGYAKAGLKAVGIEPFYWLDPNNWFWEVINLLAYLILTLTSLILWFSGLILNTVINFTVLGMKSVISSLTGINTAWKVIKDLLNIAFIFLLIYEAILIIIGQSTTTKVKTLITNIVLASLLVNFSLFFTKVMIDASNIITIGIYNTIIGDTASQDTSKISGGLSDAYMTRLGLTSAYNPLNLDTSTGATKKIGGNLGFSVLNIITAFIFFAVSVLFIVRFIVLIILLTLSPVAYMGMALPQLRAYADEWWNTLWGQLIFAPLFMIMTWVVVTLMQFGTLTDTSVVASGSFSGGAESYPAIQMALQFAIIIGLAIASIITSKKYATQGSALVGKLSNGATKLAGNAVMGGAAFGMRNTIGRGALSGTSVAELEAKVAQGGEGSTSAKAKLALAKGSFDFRRSTAGGAIASQTGVNLGSGLPFKPKAGEGGVAGVQGDAKKKSEATLDTAMKPFVEKRDWAGMAEYMKGLDESKQQYIYKKLSAKERGLLNSHLTTAGVNIDKLREKVPLEEQLKAYTDDKKWDGLLAFIESADGGATTRTEQDQADLYSRLNDRDKVSLEKEIERQHGDIGGKPNTVTRDMITKLRKNLSLDDKINMYKGRQQFDELATFAITDPDMTEDKRNYVYEKLSPRDRVELEKGMLKYDTDHGGTAGGDALVTMKDSLSKEEQDKTKDAAKKVAKEEAEEQKLNDIEALVAGGTPTTPSATFDTLLLSLKPDMAAKLSLTALNNPEVIKRLEVNCLKKVVDGDNIDLATKEKIFDFASNPSIPDYRLRASQQMYFGKPEVQIEWGVY